MANQHEHNHDEDNHDSHDPSEKKLISKKQDDHSGHSHAAPTNFGQAFIIAIALNTTFVVVEFGFGFVANSTALMADAGHNLSDVLGLVLAWGAAILSKKAPSERYTYGLRSTSILAALANAMFLLVACGAIAWEAILRFSNPPVVAGLTVTIIAAIGILINGISAWLFVKGSKGDLNIRGAYMHLMADAVVSLGVVISGIIMIYTGWNWLDPAVSLVVTAVIVLGTWGLLRDSVQLALSAVPAHIEVSAVDAFLRQCTGVTDIHDLHIWGMSTTESALTVHLVMPNGYPSDAALEEIVQALQDKFSIHHSTIQVEQGTSDHSCSLNSTKTAHVD